MNAIKKWGWLFLLGVIGILFLAYNVFDGGLVNDQMARAREAKKQKANVPEKDINEAEVVPEPEKKDEPAT